MLKYWKHALALIFGIGIVYAAGNQPNAPVTTQSITVVGDYVSPTINLSGSYYSLTFNLIDTDYHDPSKTFTTTIQYNSGGNNWVDGPDCSFRGVAGTVIGPGGQVNPPPNCSGNIPIIANKARLHITTNSTITGSVTYLIQ